MLFWIQTPPNSSSPPLHEDRTETLVAPRRRRSNAARRALRYLRLATTGLFVLCSLYSAYRFYDSYGDPTPPIPLNPDLSVVSRLPGEAGRFGVHDGAQLLALNGRPINSRQQYRVAAARECRSGCLLEFRQAPVGGGEGETVRVFWYEAPNLDSIQFDENLRIVTAPTGIEALLPNPSTAELAAVNGIAVSSLGDVDTSLNAKYAANPVFAFTSARPSLSSVVSVTLVSWDVRTAVLIAGIATGLIALVVIWLKGFTLGAWGFHIFALNIALFSLARSVPFPSRNGIDFGFYLSAQVLLPAACVFFLVAFCPPKNLVVRPPSWLAAASVLALGALPATAAARTILVSRDHYPDASILATAAFVLAVPALFFALAFTPVRRRLTGVRAYAAFGFALSAALALASAVLYRAETKIGLLGTPIFTAWQVQMLILVVITLSSDLLLRLAKVPISLLDKKRSRIIRVAVLFAFLPILAYILLRTNVAQSLTKPRIFAEAALIVFPLVIAHGILRQNMLSVGKLLLESMTYVVLLFAGFVIYPLAVAIIAPVFSVSATGTGPFVTALAVSVTVLLCGLTLLLVRSRYGKTGELGQGLEAKFLDALHDNASTAESVNDVYAFLETQFHDILQLDELDMIVAADTLALPAAHPSDRLGHDHCEVPGLDKLHAIAAAQARPVFARDLEDALGLTDNEQAALEAMQVLDASVALPLAAKDATLGTLTLGRRSTGDSFTAREFDFLNSVNRRVAASIAGAAKRQQSLTPTRVIDIFPRFPKRLGKFDIEGVIGQGGMSYVYRARLNGSDAALKIANHRVQASPFMRTRFEREAEILQSLHHKHIVSLIEHGRIGDEPYIALEFSPLGALDAWAKQQGRIPEDVVIQILRQLVGALAYAHQRNVLHRDVKPHNIYRTAPDHVKLGDFGAARFENDDLFTITGEIVGTVAYMSPERLDGKPADWRADQYALGVTAYELLTGTRPFIARNLEAQIISKLGWASLDKHELFDACTYELATLISTMLMPNPNDRFSSYTILSQKLDSLADPAHSLISGVS